MKILDLFSTRKACRLLVNLEGEVVEKYGHFKEFLKYNYEALNLLAELEQLYYGGAPFSMGRVEERGRELLAATRELARSLNGLGRGKYEDLVDVLDRISQEVTPLYYPAPFCPTGELVLPLESLTAGSYGEAGGKATNLALMASGAGLPVPFGFVITSHAFARFLEEARLMRLIELILATLSPENLEEVEARSREIQALIQESPVPPALAGEIFKAYEALEEKTRRGVLIAMRSSAVGEDSEASFAGQYSTRLNVGREELLDAYKEVVASKYSARAILYRLRFGLDDRDAPMCVAGVVMVDAVASGVLYTVDPARPAAAVLKISAIWGQGEHLVSGEASPDEFYVDKGTLTLLDRTPGRKEQRLVALQGGGLGLEEVPEKEQAAFCLDDDQATALARAGLGLEEYFGGPQDIEWAVDRQGRIFFLQSRPLGLVQGKTEELVLPGEFPGHPVLLAGGKAASPGVAAGVVWRVGGTMEGAIPKDAILVARTASPDYASLMGRIKGLITEVGSVTSHLASVAREFGVPAIVNAGSTAAALKGGQAVTMVADAAMVYEGLVGELAEMDRPVKKHLVNSPMHQRLRAVLDRLSPLNLTDPRAPDFAPQGCRTLHDVIRFAHEKAMEEMFGLGAAGAGEAVSARLATHIPLPLHLIDLGGGLKQGLTTCHEVTAEHLESIPMKALWQGLSHPGIKWSGGLGVAVRDILTLMTQGMMQRPGELPGGDSYAILSREYVNLSAKFGYHYATLDALVGEKPEDNYFSLQFAGGAGDQMGRSLRLSFLGEVLSRLGCKLKVTGDLLDASLSGLDQGAMEAALEQVGRLLGSSRLLDVAITGEADVNRMVAAFLGGDYDFLRLSEEKALPGFYTLMGDWRLVEENGKKLILQDGSAYGRGVSSGLATMMGKMVGVRYQEFLDNIGAYYYFPLAVARDSRVADARLKVLVKATAGKIDQAGGLAFGLADLGNYFVLRINALEDNLTLFEYVNNKRFQRVNAPHPIVAGQWYGLAVEVEGRTIKGYLDGELLITYMADRLLEGYVGLWTKADSVTYFAELAMEADGRTGLTPG